MSPFHRALLDELFSLGLRPRLHLTGGAHVRIEWTVGTRTDFIVTSLTPSDRRALLNARAELRRRLKAAGITLSTDATRRASLAGAASHLRNELAQLRGDVTAHARIREIESKLAWRLHAPTESAHQRGTPGCT